MSSTLDIVSQIRSCRSQGATGALFLKLTSNKLLQLFFEQGELRSIKYHGLSGMEALKAVLSMAVVKSQFHKGATSRVVNELPATLDIINMINEGYFDQQTSDDESSINYVNAREKEIIKSIFTEYVGPIADLVFSEELKESISANDLIVSLSLQMDSSDDQIKFSQEVREAINI